MGGQPEEDEFTFRSSGMGQPEEAEFTFRSMGAWKSATKEDEFDSLTKIGKELTRE